MRDAVKATPRTAKDLQTALKEQEQTEEVKRLVEILDRVIKRGVNGYIYDTFLAKNEPKFLYFDEYYQMTGHENIEALIQRQTNKQLKQSDHPLIGLIRLARLELSELINPNSTIELKSKLEGASNHLTRQILKYWSQNKHLRMTFEFDRAVPVTRKGCEAAPIFGAASMILAIKLLRN